MPSKPKLFPADNPYLVDFKYDLLTVKGLNRIERRAGRNRVLLDCDCRCGGKTVVIRDNLLNGHTRSCGCERLNTEGRVYPRQSNSAWHHKTHGMSHSREYRIYRGILSRCYNPNSEFFSGYGGRGIRVCDRWRQSFANFYADMGPAPTGKEIDRVDNDGDYRPDNCQWATHKQQMNNRRNNVLLELDGETKTLAQWCELYGQNYQTVRSRLNRRWGLRRALSAAPRERYIRKDRRQSAIAAGP